MRYIFGFLLFLFVVSINSDDAPMIFIAGIVVAPFLYYFIVAKDMNVSERMQMTKLWIVRIALIGLLLILPKKIWIFILLLLVYGALHFTISKRSKPEDESNYPLRK